MLSFVPLLIKLIKFHVDKLLIFPIHFTHFQTSNTETIYTWDSFGGKKVAFTVERIIQSFLLEEQ